MGNEVGQEKIPQVMNMVSVECSYESDKRVNIGKSFLKQTAHFLIIVAYTPERAIFPILKRRGDLKLVTLTKCHFSKIAQRVKDNINHRATIINTIGLSASSLLWSYFFLPTTAMRVPPDSSGE